MTEKCSRGQMLEELASELDLKEQSGHRGRALRVQGAGEKAQRNGEI